MGLDRSNLTKEFPVGNDRHVIRTKTEVAGIVGPIWMIGWLFTVGFVHLAFGKAILALVLWPYYLGSVLG